MPDKEFIRICSIKEVPRRRGKQIDLEDGVEVAVFNIDGTLYAINNVCPHQHASVLADGMIEECTVTCPLHGWSYDLETGQAIGGSNRVRTYEIYLDGDDVMLEKPQPEMPRWMGGGGKDEV